jgi:endonuclease/exonuclease/phosphatase family metal-dependent hydrolase
MPFYQNINTETPQGKRTIERLLKLREKLRKDIPARQMESTLLLATWNIREFGADQKYGKRSDEAMYYIAEIISKFDLVAVQEVHKNLKALDKLMSILGSKWEYMFTDVTEGRQGNNERQAFIYDTRKVAFGGLSGELVIPPIRTEDEKGNSVYKPLQQLARTPYICGFKAGWVKFVLSSVHILYGEAKAEEPERVEEIKQLAAFMAQKSNDRYEWAENMILLGDFNIFKREDSTMEAITSQGFTVPKPLWELKTGSNALKNKFYDQIAVKTNYNNFEATDKAGIFDLYDVVYRNDEVDLYAEELGEKAGDKKYFDMWRTFQMSDHLPMWVEIKIDHTDSYLKYRLKPKQENEDNTVEGPSVAAKKTVGKKKKKPVLEE